MKPLKLFLTLLPFAWTIGGIPFANRIRPFVLGLPFLAFWVLAGILIAFLCLLGMYRIDSSRTKL